MRPDALLIRLNRDHLNGLPENFESTISFATQSQSGHCHLSESFKSQILLLSLYCILLCAIDKYLR